MPAGSLIGALCSSFLADRLSRKVAIQIAAIIWCVGAIFQAAANGIPLLCVGRVVGGFAIGICSAIVPVYQSEIAPKEIRGRVVSLQQWAITWGILIQYFIQYGSSFYDGGVDNEFQGTAAFRIPWGKQHAKMFNLGHPVTLEQVFRPCRVLFSLLAFSSSHIPLVGSPPRIAGRKLSQSWPTFTELAM